MLLNPAFLQKRQFASLAATNGSERKLKKVSNIKSVTLINDFSRSFRRVQLVQLHKYEYLLAFFALFDSELNNFGFWTAGQAKQAI